MLAQSIASLNTDSMDSSGGSYDRSGQMIFDLAEQSVNNFVRNMQNSEASAGLPIAATVVPNEEDLESLIRSRLEAELQTHLSKELHHFRQNLFREILKQREVQVADPVIEEEPTDSEHSNRFPTLLEQFMDEDDSSSDLSHSGQDQLAELESQGRRLPNLRNDFRRSIRHSIRMELGNLEEELDVEQAPVVESIRSAAAEAHGVDQTFSSTQEENGYLQPSSSNGRGLKGRQFVFSSRGLLGSLFLVFLVGALVGAGAAILTMESIRD